MKTKRILWLVTANIIAAITIVALFSRRQMMETYGDRYKPHSFIMNDSVVIDADYTAVYNFFIHHYNEIYPETSVKHQEFKLLNSDSIAEGSLIDCKEGDDNQMVYHTYTVREVIPDKLVFMSSEASTVRNYTDKSVRENHCHSSVYIDFLDLKNKLTGVEFTLIIQMPSGLYKLIGSIAGGRKAREEWESHLREELEGFRRHYYLKNTKDSKQL